MDFKEIKELIRVFDKSELNKLKVKDGEFEISMQTGFEGGTVVTTTAAPVAAPAVAAAPVAAVDTVAPVAPAAAIAADTIDSPMVGTYYSSPSPEAPAFIKVGDTVKKGQTLCILEAMKIMNEVEAEFDCKIVEILVKDGDPVEFDMPIFTIEKI
ncbi:acetyl-CoA carboxylase biotin carboxyl carrier protein [Poseidonibacter ostreae]|uniref:Biotin carboxyl carrier protein of acetyl-CoA carboxylase n=1 Tax=Poseidonibacter ostreae TaxID=2654171 RepID=A0A6L4WW16_9BACT|nr:acetyl-CoA carboxylase biotin carboxyl carrier protein [Poseidonibacter ostreae]KAB7887727.1 acetyl-CoA carboxylase biotin carboxyl carrier protein [Poseidonibacter ostreae]KAB7889285.1 acetyl-CoA carboxylase biotin carboxyl carrier protein [Poseidonibacter ostreae]KAB7892130.1 acetyl-CoA carboxylase biotin carboxyl carrier protein [Poseidonibacter ostreae]MAD42966.1 acetyl-CoA carboxylase, biotin carboxyl carrier protein [Arcobacter sp.]